MSGLPPERHFEPHDQWPPPMLRCSSDAADVMFSAYESHSDQLAVRPISVWMTSTWKSSGDSMPVHARSEQLEQHGNLGRKKSNWFASMLGLDSRHTIRVLSGEALVLRTLTRRYSTVATSLLTDTWQGGREKGRLQSADLVDRRRWSPMLYTGRQHVLQSLNRQPCLHGCWDCNSLHGRRRQSRIVVIKQACILVPARHTPTKKCCKK